MTNSNSNRITYIDRLRGVAVVAMFHVHSAVAWMTPEAKETLYFNYSMKVSGMVAPVFMFLAGISMALVADKQHRLGVPTLDVKKRLTRRGLEIWAAGYGLHLFFFVCSGHWSDWIRVFKVDILHCIGISMSLLTWLAWPDKQKRLNLSALIVFIGAPLLSTVFYRVQLEAYVPTPLAAYFSTQTRLSLFPFVPYVAWMSLGLLIAPFFVRAKDSVEKRRRFWWMLALTAVLMWLAGNGMKSLYYALSLDTAWTGVPQVKGLPHFFCLKGAVVLVVFLVFGLVSRPFDRFETPFFVRFGKRSLFAYAVHLAVIYPLLGSVFKRRLEIEGHVLATLTLTAVMFALVVLYERLKRRYSHGLRLEKRSPEDRRLLSKPSSVKDLTARIWQLESELGLLEKPIGEVKVWQLLRMDIYYALAKATGIFSEPHTQKERFLDIVKTVGALPGALLNSPRRGSYTKRILVFDHMRKVRVDGRFVDIYTAPLLETLPEAEVDVIEHIYLGKHLTERAPNRRYLDGLAIGSFLTQKLTRCNLTREEREFISMLTERVTERFGVAIDLDKKFRDEIRHFNYSFRYYTTLLEKRRPEKIYLVVSYSYYKRPLIAAAKALGIETIEIQHGTLSPYHLGYNFPSTEGPLDYFPDRFLTFGDYWQNAASYPLPKSRVETVGFPHFNRQKSRYDGIPKRPNQVVIISQGAIGKRLSEFVLEALPHLQDRQIVYKLHPGEYDRWRSEYPALVKAAASTNVEVVDHNKSDLYGYFAKSAYQIGCFSTALYEGLAFGCKTVIVDLPGAEYMDDLVEKGIVKKIHAPQDIVSAMAALDTVRFDSRHFFGE